MTTYRKTLPWPGDRPSHKSEKLDGDPRNNPEVTWRAIVASGAPFRGNLPDFLVILESNCLVTSRPISFRAGRMSSWVRV